MDCGSDKIVTLFRLKEKIDAPASFKFSAATQKSCEYLPVGAATPKGKPLCGERKLFECKFVGTLAVFV